MHGARMVLCSQGVNIIRNYACTCLHHYFLRHFYTTIPSITWLLTLGYTNTRLIKVIEESVSPPLSPGSNQINIYIFVKESSQWSCIGNDCLDGQPTMMMESTAKIAWVISSRSWYAHNRIQSRCDGEIGTPFDPIFTPYSTTQTSSLPLRISSLLTHQSFFGHPRWLATYMNRM